MSSLNMYKLVTKEEEDELVEITECKIPSHVLPQWQEKYDGFYIEITLTADGLKASLPDGAIAERGIEPEDAVRICADLQQLIEASEMPEALPTIADRYTKLLGATIKLESLVYLSQSPENVRSFLENQI